MGKYDQKITAKSWVAEGMKSRPLPELSQIAEEAIKKLNELNPGELPDLYQVARDEHVSPSLVKNLIKQMEARPRELQKLLGFWTGVRGEIRRYEKAKEKNS